MGNKHPYANCEECPLQDSGRFVPSEGPEQAEFAFVGEAPGVQEAQTGRPFMGPSGNILNVIMKHHGIRRKDVLLTNACLCRPQENATPPAEAIAACRPRLKHELEERGIKTAVAMGNSAAMALLSKTKVTQLRVGPPRPSTLVEDLQVVPTIHPAASLRAADHFPSIVADVGKLFREARQWVAPDYWVVEDVREALEVIRWLGRTADELTIDIEAGIEKDTAFDHPNHYDLLCIGVGYRQRRVVVFAGELFDDAQVCKEMGNLLRAKYIVEQNGKFDNAGVYPKLGQVKTHFDTMLASYAVDERKGIHNLEYQGTELLGAPNWKGVLNPYLGPGKNYSAVPRSVLYKYNAYDVSITRDVSDVWRGRLSKRPELRRLHDHLVAASNELMFLELNGIAVDRKYLNELEQMYIASLRGLLDSIEELMGWRLNPNSHVQVKKAFAEMRVKVPNTTKETVAWIISKTKPTSKVHQFCLLLQRFRKEAKAYGTYVKGIRKRLYRGRVYSTFLLIGTSTGRLSSRNPNLQNIPRDSSIRRLFVPSSPANCFIQADYSQAELRVFSWLAGDTYFRDIFNEGTRDLFDELTPILYPGSTKEKDGPVVWKEKRTRVKGYVYGLGYGREYQSIADEFGISGAEAKRGMAAFFEVIPEIVAFREETRAKVLRGEDLVSPFGRHRRFHLITKENRHEVMNEALAFLPQTTSSDICLDAMAHARPRLKGIGWIRNIVHDSILAEGPRERASEIAVILNEEMLAAADRIVKGYVRFATETKTGNNWGEV